MVFRIGTLATRNCEPRQARKGAAATMDSGAGMRLVRDAALLTENRFFRQLIHPLFGMVYTA